MDVTWWAIAIIAGSILIDYNRARSLKTAAEKHGSEALEADALHFSSDMWSSLVVLVGLGGVWFGIPWADSAAALVLALFVCLAGTVRVVVLDRASGETYSEDIGEDNPVAIYVPGRHAHGYEALTDALRKLDQEHDEVRLSFVHRGVGGITESEFERIKDHSIELQGLPFFVDETGGGYMRFDDVSEINPIMTEVTEELHHQYLLGFTPAVLDGKVHKLDVKLDQPNYTVRARKTYVAEAEK